MEYFCTTAVSCWKVINRRGELEATFTHLEDAENFVFASGCAYLYSIYPVKECV